MGLIRALAGPLSVLGSLVILSQFIIVSASAWSNGGYSSDVAHPDYGTHDWIAEAALELQVRDANLLSTTYHADYLLGTEAPDNPSYIGDTSEHHVYYWSSRVLQDDSSAVRAADMYRLALEAIESGNEGDGAFYAGAMTHYMADIGVFGHTMGSGTDWGSEAIHQDYENAVDDEIVGMDFPSLALADKDVYNATLGLALTVTFGSGSVRPNVWMDDNFDWANATYRASAFASVYEAVSAVASALNHLLIEWGASIPDDGPVTPPAPQPPSPPSPPPPDDTSETDEPATTGSGDNLRTAAVFAAVVVVAGAMALIARHVFRR